MGMRARRRPPPLARGVQFEQQTVQLPKPGPFGCVHETIRFIQLTMDEIMAAEFTQFLADFKQLVGQGLH